MTSPEELMPQATSERQIARRTGKLVVGRGVVLLDMIYTVFPHRCLPLLLIPSKAIIYILTSLYLSSFSEAPLNESGPQGWLIYN
jgi:hypothetical protein